MFFSRIFAGIEVGTIWREVTPIFLVVGFFLEEEEEEKIKQSVVDPTLSSNKSKFIVIGRCACITTTPVNESMQCNALYMLST